jgi:16S rRNA (cytosine1402-N4)-methyltransferase
MAEFAPQHIPVLTDEVLQWIDPRPGKVLVDGTLGGGGHSRALASRVMPGGRIIALDRDPEAVQWCESSLKDLSVEVLHASYGDLPEVLASLGVEGVDGIVLDLGLSSDQLADRSRGFSFEAEGPLDLRFDTTQGEPAYRLINRLSADHLADLIYQFGEERYSRRIARRIVEHRRQQPIKTAVELAQIVRRAVPTPRGGHRIDSATRTFQALRIAVNDELGILGRSLERFPDCLKPQGRLAIISFHSLEDRLVKEAFRDDPRFQPLTKKPIQATDDEIQGNPRSRSAKLRIAARA